VPPIDANRTVIVVMTGSLGARKVNRAVSALAQQWASRNDITIVHVSGRRDFEEVANNAPELRGLDYRIVPFANMVELWQWCDLALCRAGAMTIGELTALAIPALLVPLPGAPGDHQTVNARSLVEHGAARMLPDAECNAPHLARALEEMMVQPTRDAMSSASRALGHLDATSRIVDVLLEVAA
jgi:UDP-N-acetylglucosamine--N-acetylmuramyl-(pentapeptide) pyrophosphoryl-undecaprenol N-acetylglucosamine transferase